MSSVHVYTSFSYAYLSRARILAQSLRQAHPDWTIWAILVDKEPKGFTDQSWKSEFDEILDPEVLFDDWHRFIFKHDVVEACTAVKGRALEHILASGAEKVIYLDPDIAVFHPLDRIATYLDTHSVVLTPHQITPNTTDEDFAANEQVSLKYGVYNLGFIAVRNDEVGRAVASWWASCLYRACYDDVPEGIFTDQRYCDLIPSLFDNVYICRDAGYNVASWNLSQRRLRIDDRGDIRVNDDFLRFYHFTKINSDGEDMTRRFAAGNADVFEIWNWYKRRLLATAVSGIPGRYWYYNTLLDGTLIPHSIRKFFRENLLDIGSTNPFEPLSDFVKRVRANGLKRYFEPVATARSSRVLCVIHAFYPELLPDMLTALKATSVPLDICITTPPDKVKRVEAELAKAGAKGMVIATPNQGRDILPFMTALRQTKLDNYSFVLKLHTKRSKHRDDGEAWRRELVGAFLDDGELSAAVRLFSKNPQIGVLGPEGHNVSMVGYMGSNEHRLAHLKNLMGVGDLRNSGTGFIAGSMFMARIEALEPLLALDIASHHFEEEAGQTDATLAHSIERAITFSAAARLLQVGTKSRRLTDGEAILSTAYVLDYEFAPRSHQEA